MKEYQNAVSKKVNTYLRFAFIISVLSFFVLIFSGCTPKYIHTPLEPIVCGKDLDKKYLEPCATPSVMAPGTTFEQGLDRSGQLTKDLKECSVKAKVLQDVIKSCGR